MLDAPRKLVQAFHIHLCSTVIDQTFSSFVFRLFHRQRLRALFQRIPALLFALWCRFEHLHGFLFSAFDVEAGIVPADRRRKVKEAARPISIARLKPLRVLHLRPINVVVFHGSSGGSRPTGNLFLGWVSRLDAFSVYPLRTWLLRAAPGGTTDTPVVRPTRSSRTKVRFLQISNAHIG